MRDVNLALGRNTEVITPPNIATITVEQPDGTVQSLPVTQQTVRVTPTVWGVHSIQTENGGEWPVAVNTVNKAESDLQKCASGQFGDWVNTEVLDLQYASMSWLAIIAALALMALHQLLLFRARQTLRP